MKNIFLTLLVVLIFRNINAQIKVTFLISMHEMVEKEMFNPKAGDKLYVRGSFNNWTVNNIEMLCQDGRDVYQSTSELSVNINDTVEYKYIIEKSDGRIFWESNPNPSNSNYGNRWFVVTDYNITLELKEFSFDRFFSYPVNFSLSELEEDFDQAKQILESNHPALYDYTSKETLDSIFESSRSQLMEGMSFHEFYKLLSLPVSNIGCGHTSLWIPSVYWSAAFEGFFPLRMHIAGEKVFVEGFYGDKSIPLASEILSINGEPITKIINELKAYVSADAGNKAFKLKVVEEKFSIKYALLNGQQKQFEIEYVEPGKTQTKKVKIPSVNYNDVKPEEKQNELSFIMIKPDVGLLTINTFAYYSERERFRAFIDSSFLEIKKGKINKLILDLRGNDGGDPYCSSYLLTYLEKQAVTYFQNPYGHDITLSSPLLRAENPFEGRLHTLIDGKGFSTTGHFCALLKYHGIGKFVGSETGATYTCTGATTYKELQNTKITVGTAIRRRFTVVVEGMDKQRGILPDYPYRLSQEDILQNRDGVLEYAIEVAGNH